MISSRWLKRILLISGLALALSTPASAGAQGSRLSLSRHATQGYAHEILTKHMKKHWLNSYEQYDELSCKPHRGQYLRACKVVFVGPTFDAFGGYLRIGKKPRGDRYFYRGIIYRIDGACAIAGGDFEACGQQTYRFAGSGEIS